MVNDLILVTFTHTQITVRLFVCLFAGSFACSLVCQFSNLSLSEGSVFLFASFCSYCALSLAFFFFLFFLKQPANHQVKEEVDAAEWFDRSVESYDWLACVTLT